MSDRPSSKRYEPPSINLNNKNSSHTLIVELAGSNNLILEVGTSTGYLTRILRDRGNRVIGIEIDEEAAEIAGRYCDLMITGDVEELDLDDYLGPSSIDVAVFGDVLEHLRYPAAVLKKIKRYLTPQGSIVISIPNVCHGDVLLSLLEGDFRYTSMGLLDETHLRFFGLKNVVDLLQGSGYSITEIETTRLPVGETELRRNSGELPREVVGFIETLPNSDVYQFVLRAKASEDPKNAPVPDADLKPIFDRSIEGLLDEHERPLKQEIEKISAEHRRAVERSDSLDHAVSERDERIAELAGELKGMEERARALDDAVSERDGKIAELGDLLEKYENNLHRLENELIEMQRSIVWHIVMKYHSVFVERFLPHNTRRRHMYDMSLIGGRILVNEGGAMFRQSFIEFSKTLIKNKLNSSAYDDISPELIQRASKKYLKRSYIMSDIRMSANEEEIRIKLDDIIDEIYGEI